MYGSARQRHCAKFSLRGCFTARLRDFGEIVLLFNDVRDALLARHAFGPSPFATRKIRATCITRDTFEQVRGIPSTFLNSA